MVNSPAYGKQQTKTALQFAKTLLKCNHHINTIFFYQDGVTNANCLHTSASDEINIVLAWCQLAQKFKIKLNICVSASIRRGIVNTEQTKLFNIKNTSSGNIQPDFNLVGLGSFAQELFICNRFIQF